MNNIINPDPLGFRKMEKERVINELKKEIKKAESEGKVSEVKKLENELNWVKIWNWYLISSILSLILVKFLVNWDNLLIISLFIIILIINTISFILL